MADDGHPSTATTRDVIQRYLDSDHGDTRAMAPDVVFRLMATGDEYRTPDGVQGLLEFFYHQAFDATAERTRLVVDGGTAVFEGFVVGRHTGEFAGVAATGKQVRIPLAVVYDVRDGAIVEGRVYVEIPAFLAQVGAGA